MNILFTSSGRRNYLLKYFKTEVGEQGKIIAADMDKRAVSLAIADVAYKVPSVYSDEYINFILDICRKELVNIVISLNDLELPILAINKEKFEQLGVNVIISDKEVIDICFDKEASNQFIADLGYKTPITYTSMEMAKQAIKRNELSFPLIIKPRWGSGSMVMEMVETFEELEIAYQLVNIKLNKTALSEISKLDRANAILIQEKLNGDEFGIDIINDLNANYQTTIVKKKLNMRSGETDRAIIVDRSDIKELGEKIAKRLHHIGNVDCDVFDVNGELYVLELNPRFGGGYPFSHEAGVNLPKAIINWSNGECIDINKFLKANVGKAFGKCDDLIELLS